MRIMALDYGAKTVGVAMTDALQMTVQPKEIIRREKEHMLRKTYARIEELIVENEVEVLVVGLPLNMDGSEGERVEAVRAFADKLERRTGREVVFVDERLSTVEAEEMMQDMGIKAKDYKNYVDMLAATVILKDYMNMQKK